MWRAWVSEEVMCPDQEISGVGTAEEGGPSVCLSASRVFFTTFVTGTQTDSREIEITNNGSTVVGNERTYLFGGRSDRL